MLEFYHWEAHPSQYDDSHDFQEVSGDWWRQQPFTRPNGLDHRIEHFEVYRDYYPEVTIPSLVDDGPDGNNPAAGITGCVVSKQFKAMYTSIVVIGLDKKVAFCAHWPPRQQGNWTDATAKIWVNEEYVNFDDALDDLLSGIDAEAPKVSVTSPSGGEDLTVGDDQEIEWTATDNVGVVSRAIYLTADGSTWELIDSADDNTGKYTWEVSDNISNSCKIKVCAYDAIGNVGNAESQTFSIGSTGIIHNLSKAVDLIAINSNRIYIPFTGTYMVNVSDVQGKVLSSFTTSNGRGWYTLTGQSPSGIQVISIQTPQRTIVKKVWLVK